MNAAQFTITVEGRSVRCMAERDGQWWRCRPADWPEITVTGRDLHQVRAQITARLRPEVRRLKGSVA